MTIATQLQAIIDAKEAARQAIIAKGVQVEQELGLAGFADKIMAISQGGAVEEYQYPYDWPVIDTLPDNNSAKLLVADFDDVSFRCITGNTYHVDWGDGTNEFWGTGITATHRYQRGAGTPCGRGYTTFVITITASTPITAFSTQAAPFRYNSYSSPVLAAHLGFGNATTLSQAFSPGSGYGTCTIMEWLKINNMPNVTTASSMCFSCRNLRFADLGGLGQALSSASFMFNTCFLLRHTSVAHLTGITDGNSMFSSCYILPAQDISAMANLSSASNMFSNNFMLNENDITANLAIVNASGMFNSCYNLRRLAIGSKPLCTNTTGMLSGCLNLRLDGTPHLPAVTQASSMYFENRSMTVVDISSMVSLINVSSMFRECGALAQLTTGMALLNVTTADYFIDGCYTLSQIDSLNMPNATSASYMLRNCFGLTAIDISSMVKVTNSSYMLGYCRNLEQVIMAGFGSAGAGTDGSFMFYGCAKLPVVDLTGCKFTRIGLQGYGSPDKNLLNALVPGASNTYAGSSPQIDIDHCSFTADDLNALFTALPTISGKNIRCRYNPGSATCNPSIATAKGWTVTTV